MIDYCDFLLLPLLSLLFKLSSYPTCVDLEQKQFSSSERFPSSLLTAFAPHHLFCPDVDNVLI